VIREISAAVLAQEAPVLLFLAGPNGAGKSTFFKSYLQPLGLTFINADEIALLLRETTLPAKAENVDRLAFKKTEELRSTFLARRRSFCTETVFSDPQGAKLDFLRQARSSGYAVFLVFIGLSSPDLSIARVMQRVEEGGHDVPDDKLLGRYPRTLANLRDAIPIVDEAFLFDNSSDREPFRLVAVYREGQVVRRAEPLPPPASESVTFWTDSPISLSWTIASIR
jgi:predicted ABC-type ATPase